MAIIPCGIVVREPTTAVALLTWVYRDQKADVMSGLDLHGPDGAGPAAAHSHAPWPPDCCAVLARTARLGGRIRGTGHLQRPALHPDAEAVHDLVVALSANDPAGARLLRDYGRLGEIPDPCDTWPEAFPPPHYGPGPDGDAEAWAEYRAWRAALARVAAALPPLRRWQLTGLGAVEAPWPWDPAGSPGEPCNPRNGKMVELSALHEKAT